MHELRGILDFFTVYFVLNQTHKLYSVDVEVLEVSEYSLVATLLKEEFVVLDKGDLVNVMVMLWLLCSFVSFGLFLLLLLFFIFWLLILWCFNSNQI